ncbi:hypothetical protein FRC09_016486, partial [Ceratobasidium sp. 395]
ASTVPHFTSGSLPSDYATVNQFISSSALLIHDEDTIEEDCDENSNLLNVPGHGRFTPGTSPTKRRTSFGNYGAIPIGRRGSQGSSRRPSVIMPANPPEAEPLLGGSTVPRIDEECDAKEEDDSEPSWAERIEEAKVLFKYTIPVFATHLLEYSLVIASVVSVGHLSTEGLAASTLGSMTASVSGLSIVQGFASALDSLLPQAWTSENPQNVGLWAQRETVVMMILCLPILCIWNGAESILLVLRQEPEIAHLAGLYLKWLSIGLPAYAFNSVTRFIGAPIATAISFNLISLFSVLYGIFYTPRTAWHPICRRSFKSLGTLVQLGLAGTGQIASEWWSWDLVGLAASQLGPIALAAQSVLLVSASTAYQAPFALGVATTVRIGNLLGSRHGKKAKIAAE